MKKKYKLTGFARLFIFMLFFLPLVYIGVSFYHGNNPLAKIENLLSGKEKQDKPYISKERFGINDDADLTKKLKNKDSEIDNLKDRIRLLETELKELKQQSHDH